MDKMREIINKFVITIVLFLCVGLINGFECYAGTVDSDELAAQQKAHHFINQYLDPEFYAKFPDIGMTEEQMAELKTVAEGLVEGCTTDYEKIWAITEYVSDTIYYDDMYYKGYSDSTEMSPYEVYTSKKTVCEGYMGLVRCLLNAVNIPCMNIGGDNHGYNAAYDSDNDRWIFLDATWCSKNQYTTNAKWKYGGVTGEYFDMSPEKMASISNHEIYSIFGMKIDNLYYSLWTDEADWSNMSKWSLSMDGWSEGEYQKVAILDSYEGIKVTSVAGFRYNEFIEEIDLSRIKLETIGAYCFDGCKSLTKVILPSSVKEIGQCSFLACESLKEIDLSHTKIEKIGDNAFWGCKGVTSFKFPNSVKEIGFSSFSSCQSIEQMDFSQTKLESIGMWAFMMCNKLERIILPEGVTSIGQNAFDSHCKLYGNAGSYVESYAEENGLEFFAIGKFATYDGCDFTRDIAREVRCYYADGTPVINEFKCDGTYTYYFQADGTAMKDRLTYHPDGEHVIYFDENGHEVFSDFANVKKTIAGLDVDDYCFFDVYGYLYVDVVTYDKTGTYLYYANPYGVMDRGKWFEFSETAKWADGTPFDKAGGRYGYANADGKLMINQWTTDWEGRDCYMQGNGVALYP